MSGNDRRAIVIQERDLRLFKELSVLRVADRELAKVVAGFHSTTRANSRLLVLTNAGLLRRFFLGTSGGGQKALYALSPEGARIAEVPYRGPRRRQDEVLVADLFVAHQLSINEMYCTLKYPSIATRNIHFVRWMGFFEPLHQGFSLIPDGYAEILHSSGTLAAFLEVDLGSGQFPGNPKKLLHRYGGGARFLYRGFHRTSDRHVQISRREFQAAGFSSEEDVRKNGQSRSGADNILHRLKAAQELVFGDGEIHCALTMYLS